MAPPICPFAEIGAQSRRPGQNGAARSVQCLCADTARSIIAGGGRAAAARRGESGGGQGSDPRCSRQGRGPSPPAARSAARQTRKRPAAQRQTESTFSRRRRHQGHAQRALDGDGNNGSTWVAGYYTASAKTRREGRTDGGDQIQSGTQCIREILINLLVILSKQIPIQPLQNREKRRPQSTLCILPNTSHRSVSKQRSLSIFRKNECIIVNVSGNGGRHGGKRQLDQMQARHTKASIKHATR